MSPTQPSRGPNQQTPGDGPNNERKTDDQQKPPEGGWPRWAVWFIALMFLSLIAYAILTQQSNRNEIDNQEFWSKVDAEQIKEVVIEYPTGKAKGEFKNGKEFAVTIPPTDETQRRLINGEVKYNFEPKESNGFANLLIFLLPFGLLILLMYWLNRRAQGQMGSIMQIGKSKAKVYTTEKPKTTFADVAGHKGVKQEIKEVVSFLKEPRKFKELGAKIPKGALLVGPPGTGKTLLAKAVAGEAGVPFIAVTGSDFMEMFVGVGAARVRDLFDTARKQAPAVIFIDEIDSIGRKRGAGLGGGHDEREQTLNQLLSEMDGFEGSDGVVMLAATNRPDILDPALLRPGRFDRQIVVPLPTLSEREQILKVHTRDKKVDLTVDLMVVAKGTPGFSGADLANLCNESALFAVRNGHKKIFPEDFDQARDRVLMGVTRESLAMSDDEKKVTAYHEAGHALCGALTPEADQVHKVTILPIGSALGVTQFLPEERHIQQIEAIEARLVVAMGGRVAEEVVFQTPSTGAQNDLQQATILARKMVKEWGFSSKLGPVAFSSDNEMVFLGDELAKGKDYSEETAQIIDSEVTRILNKAHAQAVHILTKDRKALDLVAKTLLSTESIEGKEVYRLIRLSRGEEAEKTTTPEASATPASTDADTTQSIDTPEQPKHGIIPPPPMAPGIAH